MSEGAFWSLFVLGICALVAVVVLVVPGPSKQSKQMNACQELCQPLTVSAFRIEQGMPTCECSADGGRP